MENSAAVIAPVPSAPVTQAIIRGDMQGPIRAIDLNSSVLLQAGNKVTAGAAN